VDVDNWKMFMGAQNYSVCICVPSSKDKRNTYAPRCIISNSSTQPYRQIMSDTVKLEKNWKSKSIESLEKRNYGPIPTDESSTVQRLWKLRKVPINELQIDDIRFLIIQGSGLKYLLIEAIDLLKEDLLTEGNYYKGDLFNAVLQIEKVQWGQLKEHWDIVDALIKNKLDYLLTIEPEMKVDNFYNCRPV
jgi:hypothetical protein